MTSPLQKDLLLYARTNKLAKLVEAITAGATVDGVDETGCTPLMNAVAGLMECPVTVRELLNRGADHTITDSEGRTALMFAAWRGRLTIVCQLLKAGADPTITDREGKTALDYARAEHHKTVVELLRPLTADPWDGAEVGRLHGFDPSLSSAAVSFIRRAEAAGMRGTVQKDEIDESLNGIIPVWYSLVLTSVPLAGIAFASLKPKRAWGRCGGWFRHVTDLAQAHKDSYPEIEFLKDGYFGFASSDDGDVWVVRSRDQFDGPVFLWDISGAEAIKAYSSFPGFLRALKVEKEK